MNIVLPKIKNCSFAKNAVLMYLIMFLSGDTYLFGTNSNMNVVTIVRYVFIIILFLLVIRMHGVLKLSNNRRTIFAYLIMTISFTIICYLNHDNFNRIGLKLLFMTASLLLCMLLSFREFVNNYNKAMCFVAICAVVFTFIAYLSPSLIRMFPSVVNTADVRIYTCGIVGLLEGVVGKNLVRTQGIFWEPGVFQMYLNLAIAFELLFKGTINRKYLTIYIIALILTFSTSGYIVFAWIIVMTLFIKRSSNDQGMGKRFIIIAIFFIAAGVILQFTQIGDVVFGKLFDKANVNYGSTTVRLAGIIVSVKIALSHPLHGIGMTQMRDEFFSISFLLRDILGGWTYDNTNTLLYQFAAYGIPYGIFFTIGMFKYGNNFGKGKKIITISIFIMLFMLYIGENLQYSVFPYTMVLYGYGWKENLTGEELIAGIAEKHDRKL